MNLIHTIIIWAVPVIFAITVHEVAHGWVANLLGDPTAKMMGRLTLNPIKHIDILGTLIIPGILLLLKTGFIFGWAKPVPITWRNLGHQRRDIALVAAAGPGVNLLMALFWACIFKAALLLDSSIPGLSYSLSQMGQAGIIINIVLLIVNLIPIPPLDGSRIVSSLLPPKLAYYYNRIEPYGFYLLLLLLITHLLNYLIQIPFVLLVNFITHLFNLSLVN